jgi:uroporphyrinogen-III synthase
MLRERGAIPVEYPCIEIVPVEDTAPFDAALHDLSAGRYQWLALTSANAVFALAKRLERAGMRLEPARFRTAAIGPATAEAAQHMLGLESVSIPEEYVAEAMGEALPVRAGQRVLLPESAIARPALAGILRARGAEVTVIPAYRTVRGSGGEDVPGMLARGEVHALTFASSSAVVNFVERLRHEGGRLDDARFLCAACIGPVTAEAARESGFENVLIPNEYTLGGLVEALADYFQNDLFTREEAS